MKLEYSRMEKLVGLFILVTVLTFLFAVAMVGRGKNWFRKHYTYYTTFEQSYNLASGARVKLFGTDIGKVTDVRLTEENLVRVTIRVLAAYSSRIRADTIATVESPTFIGSEYIAIIPGSKQAPLIPPEGEIPSREKKTFSDYLEQYQVEDKLRRFGEIIEALAQITSQLQDPSGPLFGTLSSVQRLTAGIDKGEGSLGRVVKSEELYNKIMDELAAVERILASLHQAVDTGVQVAEKARQISEHLEASTATVPEIMEHIEAVTRRTPEIAAHVEAATRQAPAIAEDLAATMSKVPDMTVQIQDLIQRMMRVTVLMERAMAEAPEISREAREGMREVNRILDAVRKNFLIRPYLPAPPAPESHGVEIRGD